MLIKGSVRPKDESHHNARRCRNAAYAIADAYPASFERLLSSVLNNWERAGALTNEDLVRSVGAFGGYSAFWDTFPSTARTRLLALLVNCDPQFLVDHRFFVCGKPQDEAVAVLVREVIGEMDSEQLESAVRRTQNRGEFVSAAISRVQKSKSFRSAESNLRVLALCSRSFAATDVGDLRQAILDNEYDQVRLTGEAETILISISADCPNSEEHSLEWKLLAEKLHEIVTQKNEEYYKYKKLCEAVGVVA